MSLPAGFLDDLRNRVSLSGVVARKVIWDERKSNQGKGDMWAPCPFHQEKSASFHVDDRKGFYYCFGCHAKGDALSFIRETENLGFMEAVEVLAREAGLTMPARDPMAAQKDQARKSLAEVMEEVDLNPAMMHRYPHEFSGGQRQRIAIARTMILRPKLVVLDEPTSALDMTVQVQIVDLLRRLQQKYGLAYIFISHDLNVVRAMSHKVAVMKDGDIVEYGDAEEVFERPRTDYAKSLLRAALERIS